MPLGLAGPPQHPWSHPLLEGDNGQEGTRMQWGVRVGQVQLLGSLTHPNTGVHSSKLPCQPQVHSSAQ